MQPACWVMGTRMSQAWGRGEDGLHTDGQGCQRPGFPEGPVEEQVVPRKGQESRAAWLWSEAQGCGRRRGAGWREDQADALHTQCGRLPHLKNHLGSSIAHSPKSVSQDSLQPTGTLHGSNVKCKQKYASRAAGKPILLGDSLVPFPFSPSFRKHW